jgi:hypothetical protein
MLERDYIQSTGFQNVFENGKVTGFQFHLRIPSYRGMWASLIEGCAVKIDGIVDVPHDVPLWTLQGKTYNTKQLDESTDVRWQLEVPAVITVPLEGGLKPGIYNLEIDFRYRMSYIPIEHQPSTYKTSRKVVIVK